MDTLEKYYKCLIGDNQEKKILRKFYVRALFIVFVIPVLIIYNLIYIPLNIYYDVINNQFMTNVLTEVEFLLCLPVFIYMIFFENSEILKKLPLNKKLFVYTYFVKKYICKIPEEVKEFSLRKMVISSMLLKLWSLFDELELNSRNLFIYRNKQLEISIANIKRILFKNRKAYCKETWESRNRLNNILTLLLELYFIKNEQEDFILYNKSINISDFEKYELEMENELIRLIDEYTVQALDNNSSSPKTILDVFKGLYLKWRKLILISIFIIIVIIIIYLCNKFIVVNNSVAIILSMAGGGIFQIIGKISKSKTPTDRENRAM